MPNSFSEYHNPCQLYTLNETSSVSSRSAYRMCTNDLDLTISPPVLDQPVNQSLPVFNPSASTSTRHDHHSLHKSYPKSPYWSSRLTSRVNLLHRLQFVLRVTQLLSTLSLLVCVICIRGTLTQESWMIRLPVSIDLLFIIYSIYHLYRAPFSRSPANASSYHFFTLVLDIGLLPFYIFISVLARLRFRLSLQPESRWSSLINWPTQERSIIASGTWILAIACTSLHVCSLFLDFYFFITFRRLSRAFPEKLRSTNLTTPANLPKAGIPKIHDEEKAALPPSSPLPNRDSTSPPHHSNGPNVNQHHLNNASSCGAQSNSKSLTASNPNGSSTRLSFSQSDVNKASCEMSVRRVSTNGDRNVISQRESLSLKFGSCSFELPNPSSSPPKFGPLSSHAVNAGHPTNRLSRYVELSSVSGTRSSSEMATRPLSSTSMTMFPSFTKMMLNMDSAYTAQQDIGKENNSTPRLSFTKSRNSTTMDQKIGGLEIAESLSTDAPSKPCKRNSTSSVPRPNCKLASPVKCKPAISRSLDISSHEGCRDNISCSMETREWERGKTCEEIEYVRVSLGHINCESRQSQPDHDCPPLPPPHSDSVSSDELRQNASNKSTHLATSSYTHPREMALIQEDEVRHSRAMHDGSIDECLQAQASIGTNNGYLSDQVARANSKGRSTSLTAESEFTGSIKEDLSRTSSNIGSRIPSVTRNPDVNTRLNDDDKEWQPVKLLCEQGFDTSPVLIGNTSTGMVMTATTTAGDKVLERMKGGTRQVTNISDLTGSWYSTQDSVASVKSPDTFSGSVETLLSTPPSSPSPRRAKRYNSLASAVRAVRFRNGMDLTLSSNSSTATNETRSVVYTNGPSSVRGAYHRHNDNLTPNSRRSSSRTEPTRNGAPASSGRTSLPDSKYDDTPRLSWRYSCPDSSSYSPRTHPHTSPSPHHTHTFENRGTR